jgi:hypothetical protein
MNPDPMKVVGHRILLRRVDLIDRQKQRFPALRKRRASSRSGAASSVRPSTTMTISAASCSAIRAWRKISEGNQIFLFGNDSAVSTTRKS